MEILTKMTMQHKGSNMKFDNLKLLLWTDESSLGEVLTLVSFRAIARAPWSRLR